MADTVSITPGTGAVISTDELNIDGTNQQVQRVKIGLGANNAWDMDLDSGQQTMANSIPVALASNHSTITVSGIGSTEQNIYLKGIASDTSTLAGSHLMYGTLTGAGSEANVLRVTIANNSTGLLSVDDNGTTLSVDDGGGALTVDGTVAVTNADLATLAGAVSATHMQVDVLTAPSTAVTNVGTFATQIDGAALTALQLIDNIVSGTGANISQINGVTPLMGNGVTGTGSLRVTIASDNTAIPVASHAVTNAGTFATQVDGAALTALQLIDNIVSGTGANISQINGVTPLMGNGATGTGSLRVTVANDNTVIPMNVSQINGVAATMGNGVSGTGVQRVTIASDSTGQINSMGNIVDNAGFTDATTRLQMAGYIFDDVAGTALTENDAAAARVDSKRAQTFVLEDATTRGQKATITTRGSQYIEGPTAHDSAIAANPQNIGGKAVNAEQTAVANNDVTHFVADLVGKLITLPYANPENFIYGTTSDITGTSDTSVVAAQAAGVRSYITHITITNSHATVGTFVNIKDGTTVMYTAYAAPAGGGVSVTLNVPLRGTAATAINAACVTTGSNVRVSVSGYKGV